MKNSIKVAAGLILAAGALVASGTAARAGEGASSGSVAMQFVANGGGTGPSVFATGISSSIAVGKQSAISSANTTGTTETFTSAAGGGGALTVTGANSAAVGYSYTADASLATEQANTLVNTATIGGTGGIAAVTLP
jgi:hypothetical protein